MASQKAAVVPPRQQDELSYNLAYVRDNAVLLLHDLGPDARDIIAAFAEKGRPVSKVETEIDLVMQANFSPALIINRFGRRSDRIVLVERLRRLDINTPIVMLSPSADPYDIVDCLNAGVDQYVRTPSGTNELIAHVEAAIRSSRARRGAVCAVESLAVDLVARSVRRGDRLITLSGREFDLLACLILQAGIVLSRATLLREVWGREAPVSPNIVDVHVGKLRRKIDREGEPRMIFNVRGRGFRLGEAIAATSKRDDVVLREYLLARTGQPSLGS